MPFESIDRLFESYNYKISPSSNSIVRIYTLRYGMYHAAEILKFDDDYDVSKIKQEYSDLGYATEVRVYKDEKEIEEYLFEGFFIKTPLGNELKNRYSTFVKKQIQNLPEGSKYKYIQSSYDLLVQDFDGAVSEKETYDGNNSPIIDRIIHYLTESAGATFIIIEAAAGFGKTCTANEILNCLSEKCNKKLPFFTELSRNREARVFKHILLNEIDEQFPSGIKQNIVIDQIAKGRIPLIIDGFDELITKESSKEEVESMLTTIMDLLKENAKIIITSRKTAIFSSEEFLKSVYDVDRDFSLVRFEIKEPTIQNWLNSTKIDLINRKSFPINQIANPVLLSYLRNIPYEKLQEYLDSSSDGSLIDKYIDYLLKREQVRQNIKLSKNDQLAIFRNLVRFFSEYNVTAESKPMIKEYLKEFNFEIIHNSLDAYIAEERPTIDDLVETLSNHVFLDRKTNGNIGIINDFIIGLLVGDSLLLNEYQDNYDNFNNLIPSDFAKKSVQSFLVQSNQRKNRLWDIYDKNDFPYEVDFFFNIDHSFKRCFNRTYKNLYINNYTFNDILFDGNAMFIESGFTNITFNSCAFNLEIFQDCSFHNCNFYYCTVTHKVDNLHFNNFGLYACSDNNGFREKIRQYVGNGCTREEGLNEINELLVLRQFFGIGMQKPRPRKLSYIKERLSKHTPKEISKILSNLKANEYIHFSDDLGFITKKGISHFNLNKTQL